MANTITYTLDNGKVVNAPKELLQKMVQNGIAENLSQALWIWLEDEGYIINEEQDALDKKAKASKITATIHQARADTPKERKKMERKADITKEGLITVIAEMLKEKAENVAITNASKLIEFDLNGEHFKLDLIRQRKPKK